MSRQQRIGYEQALQLDKSIATLACPNCKEPMRETRQDPRDSDREQPYCCGLLWIPYLFVQIGRPITIAFKHFDPAIDICYPPRPWEITFQTPGDVETGPLNPATERHVVDVPGERPPETTDPQTQGHLPDAEKTIYDLIGEFIAAHIEFTTPDVRAYVSARRATGKISKQGLTNALEKYISEGTLIRLKRGLYRRVR